MWGRVIAAALLSAAFAAPAEARSVAAHYELRGGLQISWHGAPGRCEAAAACDVRGTLTYAPRSTGEFRIDGRSSSFSHSGASTPAVVRVQRGDGLGTCTDLAGGETGPESLSAELTPAGLELALGGRFEVPTLSAGRCAGPLPSELAESLPAATTPLGALRRATTVDLSGTTPFSAGPFDGEVASTVTVRLRPRTVSPRRRSTRRPPRRPRVVRYRQVQASSQYAIESASGALVRSFSGSGPACALLDACGLSGHLSATLPPSGSLRVDVRAPLPAGRARPRTLRQVAALPGARFSAGIFLGEGEAALQHEATRDGGWVCRDGGSLPLQFDSRVRGALLRLRLREGFSPDGGRTHCPGPRFTDGPFGRGGVIAAGTVRLRALETPSVGITIAARATQSGGAAYNSALSGEIALALRRQSARVDVGTGIRIRP